MAQAVRWGVIAIAMTIVTILAHELAHYLAARAMGAADLRLHWADVSYDPQSLGPGGIALAELAGPAASHSIILAVWLSGAKSAAALALGLGACSRNLVLLPLVLKTLLGRDVASFHGDEVEAAAALGMSPLPFALTGLALGLVGLGVFAMRARRQRGMALPAILIAGTVAGIILWSVLGPILLAGGKGYS